MKYKNKSKYFQSLLSLLLPLFITLAIVVPVHGKCSNTSYTHALPYVLKKLQSYDALFLGTTHKKKTILNFVSDLIPHLYETGVTHLALEICSDQQEIIDNFLYTGNGLNDIALHPLIDCTEYRNILKATSTLHEAKRPRIIALDLPKSLYKSDMTRDEWMALSLAKIFNTHQQAKILVVVGNLHILKNVVWEEKVHDPHGFIRTYLSKSMPHLRIFSIGQCIDKPPNECDFTKAFGHAEGSIAIDCHRQYAEWKIGFMRPVASKPHKIYELLDGVIVH
ncbi:MAG: hypothetical protein SVW57_01840 [Thermodesulfobacteriota bacterium]|nr:hypothetical protein [Thermodesulfobacteriota bacterium]